MSGKIQNADIKTLTELTNAGADKTYLPSTEKAYTPKSDDILENTLRKNNFNATVNPTPTDDLSKNYEIGSRWSNITTGDSYFCMDNSNGLAVWKSFVTSVNGQQGDISLSADDIAETASRYWSLRDNKNAIISPDANNDITQNYVEGSLWYDKITHILYVCEDNTLGAAIWSGISGGGGSGGGGLAVKSRGFALTDGSKNEFNVQVPFINSNNKTQIQHDFEILDSDKANIYLDGKKLPEFIDALTTPAPYFIKIDSFNFELDSDYSGQASQLEIEVYEGVELPSVVPSILAGLSIKHEQSFDSLTEGVLVGVDTEFTLSAGVLNTDVAMVFVDGVFICKKSSTIITNSWHLVSSNKFIIDGDLTGISKKVYIVFFEGSSSIDSFGNVCVVLRPKLTNIILESPSLQKWSLNISNTGELQANEVVTGVVDPIRLKRDDLSIVSLEINDLGQISVNDNPSAGVVVDNLFLSSTSGLAWELFVDNNNVLYIVDGVGNTWAVKNDLAEPIFEVEENLNGTVFSSKVFPSEADLPDPPTLTTGNVNYAFAMVDGKAHIKIYDSVAQVWNTIPLQATDGAIDVFPVGHCSWSVLTEAEFRVEMNDPNGDRWALLETKPLVASDKLRQIKGWGFLPDARGTSIRVTDNGRGLDPDLNSRVLHEADQSLIGSFQNDEFKSHNHTYNRPNIGQGWWGSTWSYPVTSVSGGVASSSTGGNETRMKNINLNLFIKYNY